VEQLARLRLRGGSREDGERAVELPAATPEKTKRPPAWGESISLFDHSRYAGQAGGGAFGSHSEGMGLRPEWKWSGRELIPPKS